MLVPPSVAGWFRCTWQYLLPATGVLLHDVPSLLVAAQESIRPSRLFEFDEERYVYLGDTWDELYDPDRCGAICDAVLRGDGSGRVLRGRNRNQAVRFPNGDIEIVPGARLRLTEKDQEAE